MKILVVANQKGGVGKSTLIVHLAHYIAEAGARVLVVDLDAQQNTSDSLSHYGVETAASALFKNGVNAIHPQERITLIPADSSLVDIDRASLEVTKIFKQQLGRYAAQFNVCLIDTPPAAGLRLVAALMSADFVVSPVELETYSIHGITKMLQTIFGIRQRHNPKLRFLGMLPSRFNSHSPAQKANLADLIKAYPQLILPLPLTLRTSVAEAATEKVPVWQMSKTSARDAGREMKAALAHIVEKIGGLNGHD